MKYAKEYSIFIRKMSLKIVNLSATISSAKILSAINFDFSPGEIVAILGPNGAGKSTLFKTIMKHYSIESSGKVIFNDQDITKLSTYEIARLGLFYANQSPPELDGVQMVEFLKLITNARTETKQSLYELYKHVDQGLKDLSLNQEVIKRSVNVGFSGGQKKKSEILQAKLFKPEVLLLDEIDSGLDIDAIKAVAKYIKNFSKDKTTLVISHQFDFLKLLKPNKVIIMVDGMIAETGTYTLLEKVSKNGFKNYESKEKDFLNVDVLKNHGK